MIRPDLDSLPAYVPGVRDERAIKLSSNECAEAPLPSVLDAMSKALGEVNRYPDMGAVQLRAALAEHLGVAPEQVAVGTGSSALCQQLVTAAAGRATRWPSRGAASRPTPSSPRSPARPLCRCR